MKKSIILNELGMNYLKAVHNINEDVKPLIVSLLNKEDEKLVELLDANNSKIIEYLSSKPKYILSECKVKDYIKSVLYEKIKEISNNPKFMISINRGEIEIIKHIGFSRKQISNYLNIEIDMDFLKKFTQNNIVQKIEKNNKNKKIKVSNVLQLSDKFKIYYVDVSYKLSISLEDLLKNYNIENDTLNIDSKVLKELYNITKELNSLEETINVLYNTK